jgi:4-hydroxy-2-oxoheptanedioate aldolase
MNYLSEIRKAGGSVRTHPFNAKIPIWHRDTVAAIAAVRRQLNAGHIGIMMQEVESAQEIRDAIKAMRFAAAGGTRPDTGIAAAASFWAVTPQQYMQRADVWPLNKNGDLLVHVIVESREGLAHVREIAAEPGAAVVWAGYGTLGQVFSGDPAGREAAAQQILAACKEFKKPCGFPTNNVADMEKRYAEGWRVFVFQSRNDAAFAAIELGRKLGGR